MKSALESGGVSWIQCACPMGCTGWTHAKSAKGFPALVYHPPRA
jgi:hypothetical protein